jgi:hypothetical protein
VVLQVKTPATARGADGLLAAAPLPVLALRCTAVDAAAERLELVKKK